MPEVDPQLVAHYDNRYGGTSEWRELGSLAKAANIEALWRRAGFAPGGRLVDIGCGEGALPERLATMGFEVDGFEISASAVDAARSRGGAASYDTFDGAHLPVDDATYDLAVLSHVVEHLEHPRVLLAEAKRVARRVYVEVPLELTVRTPKHFRWTDTGHINLYSALTIRHLIESVGLRVIEEQTFDHSFDVLAYRNSRPRAAVQFALRRAAHRLSPGAARLVFVYHHGLLAES